MSFYTGLVIAEHQPKTWNFSPAQLGGTEIAQCHALPNPAGDPCEAIEPLSKSHCQHISMMIASISVGLLGGSKTKWNKTRHCRPKTQQQDAYSSLFRYQKSSDTKALARVEASRTSLESWWCGDAASQAGHLKNTVLWSWGDMSATRNASKMPPNKSLDRV